ncbi:MAG: SH3 domain-containing protein [Geobacteraceae bacterium]|nr:SH3 domain-containing protein [Geobacteraceae bacterium]
MTRIVLLTVFAIIASSCSVPYQKPAVAVIPPDYELKDVRELPQEFGPYAKLPTILPLDKVCRDSLFSEFWRKYYAPWSGGEPLSDISRSILIMKEHAGREWYGENKRKVPRKILNQLLANCDLDRFPAKNSMAVAIVPTSLRVLPTERPFFDTPDDFPFDALQNAGLKMNEPARVLHVSADGVWAFAETADANGWVPMRDIGFIEKSLAGERMKKAQIVIVRDFAPIRDRQEQLALRAKVGTIFPLAGEYEDAYEVFVAVPSNGNGVREIKVRVPKDLARRFPLEVGDETIVLIGDELIGKPYGWGEYFQGRDCSALMRDFYLPFGIWLPRGSYNQIHSGRSISFSGLSPAEKERLIREKGVPFLTIIYMKGHIMLYVGSNDGKALIFHSLWKVKVKNGEGRDIKQPVGKAIISTLTPGSELVLSNGSLLDKISSMLILRDRCGLTR